MPTAEAPSLVIDPQERQASRVALGVAGSIGANLYRPETTQSQSATSTITNYSGFKIVSDAPHGLFFVNQPEGQEFGDLAITVKPSSLDSEKSLGDPKITLKDGSEIFYYDVHRVIEEDIPQQEDLSHRDEKDLTPNRFIVVKTSTGIRFLVNSDNRGHIAPDLNTYRSETMDTPEQSPMTVFMERLGYMFVNNHVYAPSPQTFKKYLEQEGIKVEFFEDEDEISAEEFVDAYARGSYPVGAKEMNYYRHDISDDHVVALMLGGEELQRTLAHYVKLARDKGEISLGDLTNEIDNFTSIFKFAVLPPSASASDYPGYSLSSLHAKNVRNGLKGFSLSIPDEKIDDLIAIAQQRAHDFGLKPRAIA